MRWRPYRLAAALCATAGLAGQAASQNDICVIAPSTCECRRLPACPDGSTPIGFPGSCGCPAPDSCPALTSSWRCQFFAQGDAFNPGGWDCSCEFIGPPDPPADPTPPPFDPPGGFCEFLGNVCPDGS
ncbi:MAG: hypothetical protein ACXW2A_14900, partial [Burkholderiales bacterium]